MSQYTLLRQDCRFENWTAMYIEGVDVPALNAGVPVEASSVHTPVRVMLSAWGRQRSDFIERPCPIVSDAMRGVLERAGIDNIQYFQAQLQMDLTDEVFSGYWLANVIGRVSCADRLASQFEPGDDGEDGTLVYLQFDPRLAYGLSLFRMAEDARMLVVSPRIQKLLQAARLTGLLFQDPSGYERGLPVSTESEPEIPGEDEPGSSSRPINP